MKMAFTLYSGKIRGIAATIINSVLERTIDIHYVFTEQFYIDFCEEYSLAYDLSEDQLYDRLFDDWLHSLKYIIDVDYDERKRLFGTYTGMYIPIDGSHIARDVIANILNDFYANEKSFYIDGCFSQMPHILTNHQWLTGRSSNFTIYSPDKEESIILNINCFLFLPQKRYVSHIVGTVNTDIYHVTEDRIGEECKIDDYSVEGFIAALLNAILNDVYCREIFDVEFFDKDVVNLFRDNDYDFELNVEAIPDCIYTPAIEIIDVYFPQAVSNFKNRLRMTDINYIKDENYLLNKMLDLEIKQAKNFMKSILWSFLNQEQQDMILAYHQYFINFLKTQIVDKNDNIREQIVDTISYNQSSAPAFIINMQCANDIINKILTYQIGKSSPKDIMMPIRAAMDAGLIRRPTYNEFKVTFPNCNITKSSVSYYTNPDNSPYVDESYKKTVSDFQDLVNES